MCCQFEKTYENPKQTQQQKRAANEKACCRKPEPIQYHISKHAADTDMMQNQKHTIPKNKCNRKH